MLGSFLERLTVSLSVRHVARGATSCSIRCRMLQRKAHAGNRFKFPHALPRALSNNIEISRLESKACDCRACVHRCYLLNSSLRRVSGQSDPQSLVSKFRFPKTETPVAEMSPGGAIPDVETGRLVLSRPFCRHVAEPGDADAPEATAARGIDGRGREERERERPMDFMWTAAFALGDGRGCYLRVGGGSVAVGLLGGMAPIIAFLYRCHTN